MVASLIPLKASCSSLNCGGTVDIAVEVVMDREEVVIEETSRSFRRVGAILLILARVESARRHVVQD
jgi:hypothetical protein